MLYLHNLHGTALEPLDSSVQGAWTGQKAKHTHTPLSIPLEGEQLKDECPGLIKFNFNHNQE